MRKRGSTMNENKPMQMTEETMAAHNMIVGKISRTLFDLDAQTAGDEGTNYGSVYKVTMM
jgi:hypothetical protein